MKLVTVIMSVYNEEEKWVRDSIESILNQSYKEIEFIIVLDNPDNDLLKSLLKEYVELDQRIKLFINPKNLGLVNSLNFALNQSNGQYIARMDADDISLPNRLERQVSYMENKNVDFIFSGVQCIDEEGDKLYDLGFGEYDYNKCKRLLEITNCSFHPTWLVKAEIYKDLCGYRQVHYCEDYDFSLRALKREYKIAKIDEILLMYRIRSNSISRSHILTQYLNMNGILELYKSDKIFDEDEVQNALQLVANQTSDSEKHVYMRSEKNINKLQLLISEKKYGSAIFVIMRSSANNKYFRQKLWKSFKFRMTNNLLK